MNNIPDYLRRPADFISLNYQTTLVVLICVVVLYVGFILTSYSLKKLKPELLSYYPFDKFFPKSGNWSVTYFLITLIFLAILVYFFTKGGFYLAPA